MPEPTAPYSNQTTSRAAAKALTPDLPSLEEQVLDLYRQVGAHGATDEECEVAMGKEGSRTTRPRRVSLNHQGLVVDSGLTRRTKSGRQAIVWVLKKFAATEVSPGVKEPKETKASLFQKLSDLTVASLPVLELLTEIEKLGGLPAATAVVHITVGTHSTTRTLNLLELAKLRDEVNKPLGR